MISFVLIFAATFALTLASILLADVPAWVFLLRTLRQRVRKSDAEPTNRMTLAFGFRAKEYALACAFSLGCTSVFQMSNRLCVAVGMVFAGLGLCGLFAVVIGKLLHPVCNVGFFAVALDHYLREKQDAKYRVPLQAAFATTRLFLIPWFIYLFTSIVAVYAVLYAGSYRLDPKTFTDAAGMDIGSNLFFHSFAHSLRTIVTVGSYLTSHTGFARCIELAELLTGVAMATTVFGVMLAGADSHLEQFRSLYDQLKSTNCESVEVQFYRLGFWREELRLYKTPA